MLGLHQIADRGLQLVTRISAALAMISMALLVLLLFANIVGRMIRRPIPGIDDLSSILLVAVFSFGIAAAVGAGGHLSVNIAVDRLPGRLQGLLRRGAEVTTILVSSYLCYGLFNLTAAAYRSGQAVLGALAIPRFLPMTMIVLGIGLLVIAFTLLLIRNLSAARTTDGIE